MTNPISAVHNHLDIALCEHGAEAILKGFDWAHQTPPVKPIAVKKVVVVRNGTQEGNSTVDFMLEDENGQRYAFMVTGRLLKTIPC